MKNIQKLERRKLSVTGGGVLQKNHVAGLFAAERKAILQHPLQHISISYVGTDHFHIIFRCKTVEPYVGHNCGNNGVSRQFPPAFQIATADGHNLIAVNGYARFTDGQKPVCIPIKGQTQVVASCLYHGRQPLQVSGATVCIDVDAIGIGIDDVTVKIIKAVKELRRRRRGSAIGAVDKDAKSGQAVLYCGRQMINIVVPRPVFRCLLYTSDAADEL